MKYNDFFKKLTGFEPYVFQRECGEAYSNSKSVLLNAPTGSGKTWASITPFIFSWNDWKNGAQKINDYPRKLIYSLPLRTLANSLYKEVSKTINEKLPELDINVTIQTGENPQDPFFEGDIIFTTIDQTLSNILSIPLSLSKNLSNINAGAVISSYLVFDEFHLLEPKKSLTTVMILLNKLKDVTSFCLMTATLSKTFMESAAQYLGATLVKVEKNDYEKFSYVVSGAIRLVSVEDKHLNVDSIVSSHKTKTIVICNTVDKCVSIYKELIKKVSKVTKVICLHSQFFQEDRKEKERQVLEYFGKKSINTNIILITTQVIEVGLDISCDTMLTEISPINSFLQRIGRCVRWEGLGQIFVFDCKETYMPYKKELSLATFTELQKLNQTSVDYYLSQKLIENILNNFENEIFNEIICSSENVWRSIKRSWQTGDKSYARELIRDIKSISVVLLPKNITTRSLHFFDSISISPFSIKKKIEKYYDSNFDADPVVFALRESNFFDDDDEEDKKELMPIELNELILEDIVALNSEIVGYSKSYGLDFKNNSGIQSTKNENDKRKKFQIKYDSYGEHVEWMAEYLSNISDYHFAIRKIQETRFARFDFEKAIKFIIKTHDYGKLNLLWQDIVTTYQEKKSGKKVTEFIAHSDYNPDSDKDKRLMADVLKYFKVGRKPNHAGVGGFIAFIILQLILKTEKQDKEALSFIKVVSSTILRHHTSFADRVPKYEVSDDGFDYYFREIEEIYPGIQKSMLLKLPVLEFNGVDAGSMTITFEKKQETFLYFILVRILRLCDQHSFDMNPRVR